MLTNKPQTNQIKLLLFCFAIVMMTLSVSCTTASTQTEDVSTAVTSEQASSEEAASPTASFYNEAPELAALVAAGELPSVDDRLPITPKLVEPTDRIGVYGGTWNRGMLGQRDHSNILRTAGYENLMRWNEEWTDVVPNVAQSVEVNDDATEYTFRLRQGMRWSDGAPFTADDILFWYEDIYSNPAFADAEQPWLFGRRDGFSVEKVDDHTVLFKFTQPNGLFLQNLAHPLGAEPTSYPRHYLEQFHIDYNADVDTLVSQAGVADWVELMESRFGEISERSIDNPTRWAHADVPSLYAWVFSGKGYDPEAPMTTLVRNPYYWKVDPDGNQLPYIDSIVYTVAESSEALVDKVVNGEIDMQIRHVNGEQNRPTFEASATSGNFDLIRTIPDSGNHTAISLNLNHPDPVLREVFQNKDFRIGLSHAIDRQTIIDEALGGRAVAYQVAPVPSSPYYNEQLATQYLEYNVELANEYLDKAGYSERDSEGYRLAPNGERITFSILTNKANPDRTTVMAEYVVPAWQVVGIEANAQFLDRSVIEESRDNNNHDAFIWDAAGGLDVVLSPRFYFPDSYESSYAVRWGYWFSNPTHELAEEPPEVVRNQMDLYNQIITTGDVATQQSLMKDLLQISAEQFYVIGIAYLEDGFAIVHNDLQNVPEVMPFAWTYPTPAPTNPQQYFFDSQS